MVPFIGFLPDIDPTTPGALKDVSNIIPTTKGFRPQYSARDAGLSAVSDSVNSLAVVADLSDDKTTYAGTDNTLEEAGASSWTDRTRAVGGAYSCGVEDRWSFAQYGNITLAANRADAMQYATTGSSAFADLSGAPQAKHIATNQGFVMAANLSTDYDGWHCCAYNDYTDWTEAVSTQSTSGRLVGGGDITGVLPFSDGFLIFKKNTTYVANYVGAPAVWDFDEIPGDIGCASGHAAVAVHDVVAFQGNDDFYIFDGARPVSIGEGVREWFFENADNSYHHRTIATYSPVTGNITWYFVSNTASDNHPDSALVYNIRSKKWGKFSQSIHAAATYYPAGIIIDGATTDLSDLYATIDDITDVSFDSPLWNAGTANAGIIGTDNILYLLTGAPGSSSITQNTFGDDEQFSTIKRVRPRFLTEPSASSIEYSYDNTYGDSFTVKGTYNLINGKYDLLYSARWHQVQYNFTGDMEIIGAKIDYVVDGVQ